MGKKSAEPRINQITLYLSDAEKARYDEVCAKYHINRADFLRAAMYMALSSGTPSEYFNTWVSRGLKDGVLTGNTRGLMKGEE